MFFVAVIIARLRFNGLVGFANYSTQTAEAFNDKEEHLARQLMLHPTDHPPALETRLAFISEQIAESLSGAKVVADQLRPIIHYMGIFRHLGVLSFLGALVASALWLAPSLAVCFGIIGIIAYGYPTFDRWVRDGRLRRSKLFRLPYLLRSRR